MKYVPLLAGIVLALLLVACGGSSSTVATGPTGTTTAPAGARIEAVVLDPTTFDNGSLSNGQTFLIQDLGNIEVGDNIQFELAYYDAQGRHTVNPGNWQSSDTSDTYGTLTFNSGIFSANGALTLAAQTVTTFYDGQIYSAAYSVLPRQERLRGVLWTDVTDAPVANVQVQFFGPQNPDIPTSPLVFRGSVTTAYDGTFRASIPPSVNSYTLVNNTLPKTAQQYIRYESGFYQTSNAGCYAPITPQSDGERFMVNYGVANPVANGTILLLTQNESVPTTTACTFAARHK